MAGAHRGSPCADRADRALRHRRPRRHLVADRDLQSACSGQGGSARLAPIRWRPSPRCSPATSSTAASPSPAIRRASRGIAEGPREVSSKAGDVTDQRLVRVLLSRRSKGESRWSRLRARCGSGFLWCSWASLGGFCHLGITDRPTEASDRGHLRSRKVFRDGDRGPLSIPVPSVLDQSHRHPKPPIQQSGWRSLRSGQASTDSRALGSLVILAVSLGLVLGGTVMLLRIRKRPVSTSPSAVFSPLPPPVSPSVSR